MGNRSKKSIKTPQKEIILFGTHRKPSVVAVYTVPDPCQNLLCAIVERAVADLYDKDRVIQKGAKRWILSHCTAKWTFFWVCKKLHFTEEFIERLKMIAHVKELPPKEEPIEFPIGSFDFINSVIEEAHY